jgi:hypothetical protein
MPKIKRLIICGAVAVMFATVLIAIFDDRDRTTLSPQAPEKGPDKKAGSKSTLTIDNFHGSIGQATGPSIDEHTAMAFLFPGYDREKKTAFWCPEKYSEIIQYLYQYSWPSELQTIPAFFANYQESGIPHFVIIFQTERYFDSCHACTVVLGGAVFSKGDGQWRLVAFTQAAEVAGSYGKAPSDMSLVKIGPNLHAVAIEDGYRQHGVYVENFILLGPVGDRVEQILLIPESSGYNSSCEDSEDNPFSLPKCWSYDLGIRFHERPHSQYFDIETTIEGTKYDGTDRFTSFQDDAVFRFNGCEYICNTDIERSTQKPFFVQLGAFASYKSAKNLAKTARADGYPSYCDFYKDHSNESLFRVRVGNFDSRKEADRALHDIKRMGYGGYVSLK